MVPILLAASVDEPQATHGTWIPRMHERDDGVIVSVEERGEEEEEEEEEEE